MGIQSPLHGRVFVGVSIYIKYVSICIRGALFVQVTGALEGSLYGVLKGVQSHLGVPWIMHRMALYTKTAFVRVLMGNGGGENGPEVGKGL